VGHTLRKSNPLRGLFIREEKPILPGYWQTLVYVNNARTALINIFSIKEDEKVEN
jgi:hypothetical protein